MAASSPGRPQPAAVDFLGAFEFLRPRAVLEILHAEDEATVPAIAENLTVRRENPRHKTSAIIASADKGRALIEDVVQWEIALVRSLDAGLNSSDVKTALNVVTALTEKLKSEIETFR